MAKEKKQIHKTKMTDGKREIIQRMPMNEQPGDEKSAGSANEDDRGGYKTKRVNSASVTAEIEVPRYRRSAFEPKVIKKRQKDISEIDPKIISMYAKGMTTRRISDTSEEIYGFEDSEGFISDGTDKIPPRIGEWRNRPLDEVYPIKESNIGDGMEFIPDNADGGRSE